MKLLDKLKARADLRVKLIDMEQGKEYDEVEKQIEEMEKNTA